MRSIEELELADLRAIARYARRHVEARLNLAEGAPVPAWAQDYRFFTHEPSLWDLIEVLARAEEGAVDER